MMINLFWKTSASPASVVAPPKVFAEAQRRIDDLAAERRRRADSDGTLRRIRQVKEENRLL
jgi:hypothetical protein